MEEINVDIDYLINVYGNIKVIRENCKEINMKYKR